jgi:glycine dehydrogenase
LDGRLFFTMFSRAVVRSSANAVRSSARARLVGKLQARALSSNILDAHDTFVRRHLGVSEKKDVESMLKSTGYKTVDDLINATIPASIRSKKSLQTGPSRGEAEVLAEFKEIMSQNHVKKNLIGTGYYNTITPGVILRNIIENPGWYTPYTPYQAEIAQGRLEMLLNFQTMVCDLTGLPVANASLLDEATAAAEAMYLCKSFANKQQKFLVSSDCHPQTIDVLKTRAVGYDIQIEVMDHTKFDFKDAFGCLVQYPGTRGNIEDFRALTEKAHAEAARVVVASDLLALTQLTPPGEWNADVVVGSAQRFGVPLGFGGPHAGFFACQDQHKRKMPGRIIGVSRDSRGKPALRMAMQTREQHIRRDKATSNICTAQALLANTAAAYAVYHGPEGLRHIGKKVHTMAGVFAHAMGLIGLQLGSKAFFDTVHVKTPRRAQMFQGALEGVGFNLRVLDADNVTVSFDETITAKDLDTIICAFANVVGAHLENFCVRSIAEKKQF